MTKTSTRFRPYGTSVQLPIRVKAKVYLKAQAGAVIATYVYVSEDDSETSLLGKHDAERLGIGPKFLQATRLRRARYLQA